MPLLYACFLIYWTVISHTTAYEFSTFNCNGNDGPVYVNGHYSFRDTSGTHTPCRSISDLNLPISTDYIIEVNLRSIEGAVPSVMFNLREDGDYDTLSFRTNSGLCVGKGSMVNGIYNEPEWSYSCNGIVIPGGEWFHVQLQVHTNSVDVHLNNQITIHTISTNNIVTPSVGLMHAVGNKQQCLGYCEFHFKEFKLTPVNPPDLRTSERGILANIDVLQNQLYVHTLAFNSRQDYTQGTFCFVAFYFKEIDIGPATIFIENDNTFDIGSVNIYSTRADGIDVYFYAATFGLDHGGYTIHYHVFACGIPDEDMSFVCEEGNFQNRYTDYYRSVQYDTETTNDDSQLLIGWYRFSSCAGQTIPTESPGVEGVCGTQMPIWIQEPADGIKENGLTEAAACIHTTDNNCANSWMVPVYGCNGDKLYFLSQTPSHSGYCAGSKTQCEASQNLTSIDGSGCSPCAEGDFPFFDEVPTIGNWKADNNLPGAFLLPCNIHSQPGNTLTIEYEIEWYVDFGTNRVLLQYIQSQDLNNTFIASTVLQKEYLQNHLICQVRGKYVGGQLWGDWAESAPYFIGIQVRNPESTITRTDQTLQFQFTFTVPFSCDGTICMDVNNPTCFTNVYTVYDISRLSLMHHCKNRLYNEPVFINMGGCSTTVKCADWNKYSVFSIKAKEVSPRVVDSYPHTLHVVTKDTRKTWNNVMVKAKIILSELQSESKTTLRCKSVTDPHVTSFAGKGYGAHEPGEFVMYKSTPEGDPNMEVLVTAMMAQCRTGDRPMCNGAVGVRVQNEVIVIDPTSVPAHKYDGPGYGADGFKVIPRDDYKTYEIYLPRGETIVASVSWSNFLNIHIYSEREKQHNNLVDGNGLCGKLGTSPGSNDLFLRGGDQPYDIENHPIADFCQNWKTRSHLNETIISEPITGKAFTNAKPAYSCSVENINVFLDSDEWHFPKDVTNEQCLVRSSDNLLHYLRDIAHTRTKGKRNNQKASTKFVKRTAVINNQNSDWTEESAREYCVSYIAESSTGKTCNTIDPVDVERSVEECTQDIMLLGDTEWAIETLGSLREACTTTIYNNISLWTMSESENNTVLTPPIAIIEHLCPADCSGNGDCVEGICLCHDSFISFDCSLSIETPPELHEVVDGIICNTDTCDAVLVLGRNFVNGDQLSCHFITEDSAVTVNGSMSSFNLVSCDLPVTVSSVTGYTKYSLMVSNDGVHTGNSFGVVLVSSLCVTCEETNRDITCATQDNMCLIGEQCIPNGEVSAGDACFFCNSEADQGKWSLKQGCGNNEVDGGLKPLQIGLIAVASAFVAVGLMLGAIIFMKRTNRAIAPSNNTGEETKIEKENKKGEI